MEYIKINEIKRNPDNPRIIKDTQFKKLVNSIRNNKIFFEARPIIVDYTHMVIAGNQRLEAARSCKLKEVPVYILPESTTLEEITQISLLDNKHNGEWDFDLLGNMHDVDYLKDIGFTSKELGLNVTEFKVEFKDKSYDKEYVEKDIAERAYDKEFRDKIASEERQKLKEKHEAEKKKIERETKENYISDLKKGKEKLPIKLKCPHCHKEIA